MWSDYIEKNYGEIAAASLAIGSDLQLDGLSILTIK